MKKLFVLVLSAINVLFFGVVVIMMMSFKSIAVVSLRSDGLNQTKIDYPKISEINRKIGNIEGVNALFCPQSNGYDVLVVYPWYKRNFIEQIRNEVDKVIVSGSVSD